MKGKGTTMACGHKMKNKSTSGVRHGSYTKNLRSSAARKPKPSGPTSPIKGKDRGGV